MISLSEDSLICDFAQFYNIYNYKALPLKTLGVLAVGLPDNSRIKMKMQGLNVSYETLLLGVIADRLGLLIWQNSGSGETSKPDSLVQNMIGTPKESLGFDSAEEFENYRNSIIGKL